MHAGMHVRGVHGSSASSKELISASLQEYCTKILDYDVRCMLYVEEDKEIHFAEFDGTITTISIESGAVTKRLLKKCDCIWGMAAVRDELWAACSDGDIIAYHRQSGKVLHKWQAHLGGTFCIVSYGDKVISGGADWVVRVWSNYGVQNRSFHGHTNAVRSLLVVDSPPRNNNNNNNNNNSDLPSSPLPLTLWSGSDDRSIRVWPLLDSSPPECLHELLGHTDSVLCMCKCDTTSSYTVWSSGADQTIRVWDSSYRCSHKLKSHKGWVTGLVVAGRTVWSSSADKTIVIWDLGNLRVKRTLRDHSTYLRGITLANYQIVSYAADRSVRFWHCTELYQGMILKIQKEINVLMDQLTDKNRKEGELKATLVNCYSTIETLERDSDVRRQISKERDDLKGAVNELNNKIIRLEKESQANYSIATQAQSWTASQEKMMAFNFKLFQEMIESETSLDHCTKSMLTVQKIDLDVSAEKVKLLQATQKLEELYAKQTAQTMNYAKLEAVWTTRIRELERLVEGEKIKVGDAVKKKEEALNEREKTIQEAIEKALNSIPRGDTVSLTTRLQEADAKVTESQLTIDCLTRRVKEMQEENKTLNEKLIAGEQNIKSLRRRSKKEKENILKIEDYIKHMAELEEQLSIAKSTIETATAAAEAAKQAQPPPEPMTSSQVTEKVRELEEALAHARQERNDGAREYARRAIDFEQHLLSSQEESSEYARRCRELEMQLGRLERSMSRDDFSYHSGVSFVADEGVGQSQSQDVMKLLEEVETLNAERRVQKQEMEEALRSKAELAKTVESLKQESMIIKTQQKPQSAIQALIDKTHRLEAQLAQALKDNASLQKYQKDAQKQAELKQMIEGMISKVLDMETQLVQVTKERDEYSEELSQFKSAGISDRDERQKLYALQLVLNQTRAQNNILENELKGTRDKLKKEEEEGAKARVTCEHLTLRVAGLEELLKKMGNIPAERSAIHSFY